MTNGYMKISSISRIIKEIQIKPQLDMIASYLLEWLPSGKQEITSVGEKVEERKSLCPVSEIVTWFGHDRKQYKVSSKS